MVEEAKGFDIVVLDPVSLAFQTSDEDSNAEAARQMTLQTLNTGLHSSRNI